MSVNPIKGKFIKISNDEAFKAAKLDGSDKEILKVNSADQVILLDLPIVDDGVAPASNVATEAYVDGEISTLADAIDGRIDDHVGGFAEQHSADHVVFSPVGATTSIEVQAAIEEVQIDASQGITDAATAQSAIDAHLLDTADAHNASAISIAPIVGLVADEVQAALAEIQGSLSGLSFEASAISFDPVYTDSELVAIDVQAALEELDLEKVSKAGDSMQGQLTMESASIVVDYSTGGNTDQVLIQQNDILVQYDDGAGSSSFSDLYTGNLEMGSIDDTATAQDATLSISVSTGPMIVGNKTDYYNSTSGDLSIDIGGAGFSSNDAVSGDATIGSYGTTSFAIYKTDGATGEIRSISADLTSGAIEVYSNTGSGPQAILPTFDFQLTPKKYVDDADAAQATALSNHLNDTVDAHDASAISSIPAGNLAAITVQAALNELDAEKVKKSGDTMSGLLDITLVGQAALEVNDIVIGEPWGAGYSVITVKDGSTDEFYIQSADQLGAFAGNVSKQMVVNSGYTSGADSGGVQIISGDAQVSGASGSVYIHSGTAVNNTGYVALISGNSSAANSGPANVKSGDAAVDSGFAQVKSGNAVGVSGQAAVSSGISSGGTSGQVYLYSGNVTGGTGASGTARVNSGSSVGGNSGNVEILSGPAAAGSSGTLYVESGAAGAGNSGNVVIQSGTATGTRGAVQITSRVVEINSQVDMQANKIIDMANGVNPADAVNKSQLDAGLALKLDLAGGDMTGDINMQNHKILHLTMNTDADCAATKQYVDNVAEGLHVHAPVLAVRAVAITGTYDNGVSGVGATITPASPITGIDGITSFATTQRIMVKGQSNTWENGIYTVTAVDGSNHITELTRASDFDTYTEVAGGDFIFVQDGLSYANSGWVETETTTALNFGVSDPILFLQFSGAGAYSAGDGLNLDGTVFSVDVTDLIGFGVGHDSSNNFRIASEAAGDGIAGGDGVALSVDHDGLGLTFNAAQLSLAVDGMSIDKTTGSVLQVKDLGITTAKIVDDAVTADKINSDVAGLGLSKSGFTGALDVNVDSSTIEINMSDALQVKDSGITEFKLATDSVSTIKIINTAVTADKINSDVAGFGLSKSGFNNALDVNVDSSTIEINMSDALQVKDSGITEFKLATDSVSTIKIINTAVTADKINADVAGFGLSKSGFNNALDVNVDGSTLEINMSDALQVKDAGITEFKLATDSVSTIKIINTAVTADKINADVAGLGLSKSGFNNALDVNVGNGLEINMSDAVAIKLDGSSLSVSASGIKSNIIWHKESYAVLTALSLGAFFDLAHVAEVDSISAFVDRLAIHQGASDDYSVDYTGGAGGNTRIYFLNTLVGSGAQQLTSGDTVFFKYQRKAA
jgi:hypothetical protein